MKAADNKSNADQPPLFLYRYLSLAGDGLAHARALVVDRRLWFSSPIDFNDPFDCLPSVALPDNADDIRKALNRARSAQAGKGPAEVADANLRNMLAGSTDELCDRLTWAFRSTADSLGVCCFSARPDDVLMWSHYANRHRGIVLRFNMPRWPFSELPLLHQVRYGRERPTIRLPGIEKAKHEIRDAVIHKADFWAHEKEWRALRPKRARTLAPIPHDLIDAIILGARTDDRTDRLVGQMIAEAKSQIELLAAVASRTTFEVTLSPYSLPTGGQADVERD